jgi:hypothetical protein
MGKKALTLSKTTKALVQGLIAADGNIAIVIEEHHKNVSQAIFEEKAAISKREAAEAKMCEAEKKALAERDEASQELREKLAVEGYTGQKIIVGDTLIYWNGGSAVVERGVFGD